MGFADLEHRPGGSDRHVPRRGHASAERSTRHSRRGCRYSIVMHCKRNDNHCFVVWIDGNPPATPSTSSPNGRRDTMTASSTLGPPSTAPTTATIKESAVTKLLKNLTSMKTKRELTCVQFGERSPTLAVGDNRGTVMVYRVISPQTITHEGPLQQTMKLKNAITKQVRRHDRLKAVLTSSLSHLRR